MYSSRDRENLPPRRRSASPRRRQTATSLLVRQADLDRSHAPLPRSYSPRFPSPSSPEFFRRSGDYYTGYSEPDDDSSASPSPEIQEVPHPAPTIVTQDQGDLDDFPPPPYSPPIQPRWPGMGSVNIPPLVSPSSVTPAVSSQPPVTNTQADGIIKFEVPLHSAVVGQPPILGAINLATDTSFNMGFRRVCDRMGISPQDAVLGWKLNHALKSDPHHTLESADDWRDMIATLISAQRAARKRQYAIRIQNMAEPIFTKRRSGADAKAKDKKPIHADVGVTEYRILREKYACSRHKDRYCWVRADGSHLDMTLSLLTLWGKEWATGRNNASKDHPPQTIIFQDFFLTRDPPKRSPPSPPFASTSKADVPAHMPRGSGTRPLAYSTQNDYTFYQQFSHPGPLPYQPTSISLSENERPSIACVPTYTGPSNEKAGMNAFHQHFSQPSSSSQPTAVSLPEQQRPFTAPTYPGPLNDKVNAYNTELDAHLDVPGSSDDVLPFTVYGDQTPVPYPETLVALQKAWEIFPFPAIDIPGLFTELCSWQCQFVDCVERLGNDFLVDMVGIPPYLVKDFMRISIELTEQANLRSVKGKGRAY